MFICLLTKISVLFRFHEEIDDYVNFLVPTPAEHEMRELTVRRIRKVVHDLWGNKCKVYVFGSFETKLYLPSRCVRCFIMVYVVFIMSIYILIDFIVM